MRRINLTESRLKQIIKEEIMLCEEKTPFSNLKKNVKKDVDRCKYLIDHYAEIAKEGSKNMFNEPYTSEQREMAKKYVKIGRAKLKKMLEKDADKPKKKPKDTSSLPSLFGDDDTSNK